MRKSEGQTRRLLLAEQHPNPEAEVVELFNAEDYRGCVEPLEVLWWRDRSEFIRSLLRVCVALHQLRHGLRQSPLHQLQKGAAALTEAEWQGEGFDARELEMPLTHLSDRLTTATAETDRHTAWMEVELKDLKLHRCPNE